MPPRGPAPEIRARDLFPELDEDIDRRILHSETRIKYWVVAGVIANLVTLLLGGIPMVYYLGQMSEKMNMALVSNKLTTDVLAQRGDWMKEREIWESQIEGHLDFHPSEGR